MKATHEVRNGTFFLQGTGGVIDCCTVQRPFEGNVAGAVTDSLSCLLDTATAETRDFCATGSEGSISGFVDYTRQGARLYVLEGSDKFQILEHLAFNGDWSDEVARRIKREIGWDKFVEKGLVPPNSSEHQRISSLQSIYQFQQGINELPETSKTELEAHLEKAKADYLRQDYTVKHW